MSYNITAEERNILDAILPDFELNEVVNIRKSIRKSLTGLAAQNVPVNLLADKIIEFLITNEFAKNLSGHAVIKAKGMALKNARSFSGFEKMLQKQHDYIVIDDDKINNTLCRYTIDRIIPNASIRTFSDPNTGLRYLHSAYSKPGANDAIILLDINMPTLMGWDVLDEMNTFPDHIKDHFRTYMLTSSVNPKDRERAVSIPLLWGYMEKPLTDLKIKNIFK